MNKRRISTQDTSWNFHHSNDGDMGTMVPEERRESHIALITWKNP